MSLQQHAIVLSGLLALAANRGAEPSAPELVHSPEEGTVLSERFEQEWVLELQDSSMTMVVDGEESGHPGMGAEITITTRDDYTFETEILAVEDGRVTRLRRTLESVVAESSEAAELPTGETHEDQREGETVLEGVPIVFEWDEDEEAYVASFDEDADEDDPELLDGLVGEDVLASFLGADDAEEGDSWEVDLVAFRRISHPGGDLKVVKEGDAEDQDEFEESFYENLDGEIRAEHLGTRDADGVEVVVIGIEIEVETEVDRTGDLEADGMEGTTEETFAFEFELEGELLWDPEAGHGRSLSLEGSIGLDLTREQNISGERELKVVVEQSFEGTFEYRATVE